MQFYNREKEISKLKDIQQKSLVNAQMTVVTGRRRIGKTQLLLKATEGQVTLYFFVARKSESLLCQDFQAEIQEKLGVSIYGQIDKFSELFKYLMNLSKTTAFNLIIDEFQEFYKVAPSVYSDMQHYWDLNKDESKINLLLSGSVYSLMYKIFQGAKEPLFGRATSHIIVKPFTIDVLKNILADHYAKYKADDLLALYAFTGGVAKYVQILIDENAYTYSKMLDYIIKEDSLFITEGKNMLIDEFGKEYANYFSILSSIARGENTRAKIEAIIGREIGGYLTKLENDYSIIVKDMPIFSKANNKNVRYMLNDNFFMFWFRFIYKYSYIIEVGNYEHLREIIDRDYLTYSGVVLEHYFTQRFKESKKYSRIGGYWDKKGENEIDLIAINELDKTVDIVEIKRKLSSYNEIDFNIKAKHLLTAINQLKDYEINTYCLSMDNM